MLQARTEKTNNFTRIVAVEVAKSELMVASRHVTRDGGIKDSRSRAIGNSRSAAKRYLESQITRHCPDIPQTILVVCEATGGYERALLEACEELDLPCHRAHGKRVRDCARFLGIHAKNDDIDTGVILDYAEKGGVLRLYVPPTPDQRKLCDLKTRRRELEKMLRMEANRLEHERSVDASVRAVMRVLEGEFEKIEKAIAALLADNSSFRFKSEILQQTKGVGPGTAAALIAFLPELGRLTKGAAARLAGLAPLDRDSGTIRKQRHIHAGRAEVRRNLYMAARSAINHDPDITAFAQRLKARGKPDKVVVTAVMRKLLVRLNARLRDAIAHAKKTNLPLAIHHGR